MTYVCNEKRITTIRPRDHSTTERLTLCLFVPGRSRARRQVIIRDQVRIAETLSGHACNHAFHLVNGVSIADIVATGEFGDVAVKVLRRHAAAPAREGRRLNADGTVLTDATWARTGTMPPGKATDPSASRAVTTHSTGAGLARGSAVPQQPVSLSRAKQIAPRQAP